MSNYASIHVLNKERSTNEANYVKVLCAIEMKDMLNISIIIKLTSTLCTLRQPESGQA